jgi:endo-1,4-beta-xylanase
MKRLKLVLFATAVILGGYSHSQTISKTPAPNGVLKDVYKDAFLMGVAVHPAITSGNDKASQEIVIRQFNSITVENVMKAALINPQPGVYNWGPADEYVDFGEKYKMFIIGHTLVWHNQVPAWFFTNA